jgi:hypothetical protein
MTNDKHDLLLQSIRANAHSVHCGGMVRTILDAAPHTELFKVFLAMANEAAVTAERTEYRAICDAAFVARSAL